MSIQKHILRLGFKKEGYVDHIRFNPLVTLIGRVVFIRLEDNNFTLTDNTLQFSINESVYAYTTDRFEYIAKDKVILYGKSKEKMTKKLKRKFKLLKSIIMQQASLWGRLFCKK